MSLYGQFGGNPLMGYPTLQPIKRKVFVSYCHRDQAAAEQFVAQWSNVFTHRALGLAYDENIINSNDTEYVMSRIRQDYLGDSSVTIVLIGTCTHSRKYVDWEIKASLRRGASLPNGLLAYILPTCGLAGLAGLGYPHVPNRLNLNLRGPASYARYFFIPDREETMRQNIEDAFAARTTRAELIVNPQDRMERNICCKVCGITH